MLASRRKFLGHTSCALLGAAAPATLRARNGNLADSDPVKANADSGSTVTPETFANAEALVAVSLTARERAQAAQNWGKSITPLLERRVGPRKVTLNDALPPYSTWSPILPGHRLRLSEHSHFVRSDTEPGPLPKWDAEIAYAPLWRLARWLETRSLTSERLTAIYLERLEKFDPKLKCVITLTGDLARSQAKQADREIASGAYRGPLHGVPWGCKDLLDTAGIRTTYGAEPYKDRLPETDSVVVQRMHEAGAVLVAKLSLGALALNDVWFGGQTMNPWLPEEGASGSSAGPAAATAAGLVAFAIGSETEGSIVAPSMRCGVTGLRPTFGRVPRTGAMTLSWSLDKLGPMTRSVEDAILVLAAMSGADSDDLASRSVGLAFDARGDIKTLRVGYFPRWMQESPATDVDRKALRAVEQLGMELVQVSLPDWPYDSLNAILYAESAASFEQLTLNRLIDQLKVQTPDAWPNAFRQSRFISAVDFVQADRFRRAVAQEMERVLTEVDLLLVPSLRDEMLTISNYTGHPALTLPVGFVEVTEARSDWDPDPDRPLPRFKTPRRVPYGITLVGRLYDEGTIAQVGLALERLFNVNKEHPPHF